LIVTNLSQTLGDRSHQVLFDIFAGEPGLTPFVPDATSLERQPRYRLSVSPRRVRAGRRTRLRFRATENSADVRKTVADATIRLGRLRVRTGSVARGAQVAILDIDAAAARRVAAELDGAAVAFHADATDWASLNAAIAGTVERFGGIDVVVANAGIAGPTATVRTIEPETFERVVEINLLGVWRTIRAALPSIVERRGYVLAISSAAAAMSMPLWAAYAASK